MTRLIKRVADVFKNRDSKQWKIGELAESGMSKQEVFDALLPLVLSQTPPMVFTSNPGGGAPRVPKAISQQVQELKDEIGRVFMKLGYSTRARFDAPMLDTPEDFIPQDVETPAPILDEGRNTPEIETPEVTPDEIVRPVAGGKKSLRDEMKYFLRRVREIRVWMKRQEEMSSAVLDQIGIRPAKAAGAMIPAGFPADALLDIMTISWPQDSRESAGVAPFDFLSLSRELAAGRGIEIGKTLDANGNPFHPLFGCVLVCAEERQPIFLSGPMGTGKSFLLEQLALYLNLPYGEMSMAGATRGDILGRMTPDPNRPFIPSKFSEIYTGGGVWNLEEIDSCDSKVLTILNNTLANNSFHNPANGETYTKSPNFIVGCNGNTWGDGPSRLFNSREKQDGAALDRFRMGRFYIPLDESIEDMVAYRNL